MKPTTEQPVAQATEDWFSEKMSEETFWELAPSGQKCELHNGVMVMATPASALHESLQNFLTTILTAFVDTKGLGIILGSRYAIRLREDRIYEPDIIFLAKDRRSIFTNQRLLGAPDLAVEIISPDSRQYDLIEKRDVYEEAGVREYWVIDQYRRQADFYCLREGRLKRVKAREEFHSKVLPGFWLRLEWLWSEPGKFPRVVDILKELGVI